MLLKTVNEFSTSPVNTLMFPVNAPKSSTVRLCTSSSVVESSVLSVALLEVSVTFALPATLTLAQPSTLAYNLLNV